MPLKKFVHFNFASYKMKWEVAQKLERIWWKRYLKNKNVTTYLQWKRSYWQSFIEDHIPHIGSSCLDLGCGPAGIFTVIGDNKVTAVDPLIEEYEYSLKHFSREMYPDIRFITSKMESFSDSKTYDTIFCLNAINHVDDLYASIENIAAYMHDDSSAYVSTDAHRFGFFQQIFKWIPADALHPHQYTSDQYKYIFNQCGLEVIQEKCVKRGRIFDYVLFTLKKNRPN